MKSFFCLVTIVLISTYTFAQAPGSCTSTCNHGTCVNNQCVCDPGWFDTNCNTRASLIRAGQGASQYLSTNDWAYFYLSLDGVEDGLSLKIDADFSYLRIYTLLQVEDSSILPSVQYNKSYTFVAGYRTGTIGFTKSEIESVNGGKLIVGFQNGPMWTTTVSVEVEYGSSETDLSSMGMVMGVIFGIAGIIIILSICICLKKRAALRRLVRDRARRNNERNRNGSIRVGVQVEEDEQVQVPNRNQQQQKVYLTAEEVQAFFPKNQFANIKSSFPHSTCSVCLDEFVKDSECHQLYCEHIFHDVCIQKWLSKHDSCPDCRKEMTKKAIEDFLANPKPKENLDAQNPPAQGQGQDFYAPTQVEIEIPDERAGLQRQNN